MRLISSIFLLFLLLSGWVEGFHFCCRYSLEVERYYQMNASEKAIEAQLVCELVEGNVVRMVDKSFNGRRGWAYPGDFVYSAEIDGDTAYFILQEAPDGENEYRVVHMPESKRELPSKVSLQDFFSWYLSSWTFNSHGALASGAAPGAWPPCVFHLPPGFENIISPPPEMS